MEKSIRTSGPMVKYPFRGKNPFIFLKYNFIHKLRLIYKLRLSSCVNFVLRDYYFFELFQKYFIKLRNTIFVFLFIYSIAQIRLSSIKIHTKNNINITN